MAAAVKEVLREVQERASKPQFFVPPQPLLAAQGNTVINAYGTYIPIHAQVGVVAVNLTGNVPVTTIGTVNLPQEVSIEADFCEWLYRQASILRHLRPSMLDWENLAEELEDMGQSLKNSLTSHLARVFEHLLKLQYEPNPAYRADLEHRWRVDLAVHRDEVNDILDGSQTLANQLDDFIVKAYPRGRRYAGIAMIHLPQWETVLPSRCPWSVQEIRDDNFFPSAVESEE
jgi:Domain of unknown function DUF29